MAKVKLVIDSRFNNKSILENIENLGYGSIIPSVLRNGLKAINQKNNSVTK